MRKHFYRLLLAFVAVPMLATCQAQRRLSRPPSEWPDSRLYNQQDTTKRPAWLSPYRLQNYPTLLPSPRKI